MPTTAGRDGAMPAHRHNAQQRQYWNSAATAPWVALQERLDALFAPLLDAGLERARPLPGEAVIDIGCGCGASALELARRVGPAGRVTGVDISEQMLARARDRAAAERLSQLTLVLADASTHDFAPERADLVFSRLGVMFFDDPIAAFGKLRAALKPGGRLVVIPCQPPAGNGYIMSAVQAARPLLPADALPLPGPEEPGMFSFADPARVRRILEAAGLRDVGLEPLMLRMRLAGPGGAAEAAAFSLEFGPLTRAMAGVGPERRAEILAVVTESYRRAETAEGILLDGSFWIVTARR